MNDCEWNEAKRHFVLKKGHILSLNLGWNQCLMIVEQKCTETLAVVDKILWKVTRLTILNNILRLITECRSNWQSWMKIFVKFCSILFTSVMSNFCFDNLRRFQTPVWKYDFLVFFNLNWNLKLLILNVAAHYYTLRGPLAYSQPSFT
jgi:hypothetical protein